MRFSCNNSVYSTEFAYRTSATFSINAGASLGCTTTNGTKTIYVQYKDAAGNRSTNTISDTIIYDATDTTLPITYFNANCPATGSRQNGNFTIYTFDSDNTAVASCQYRVVNNGVETRGRSGK